MANWCNVRVSVLGPRPAVLRFAAQARTAPSALFAPDMLRGESCDLSRGRLRGTVTNAEKVFYFQVRNDDGREHFRRLSTRWPRLSFVLTYGDQGFPEYGSYLVSKGRSLRFVVSEKALEGLLKKRGYVQEPSEKDEDENEWRWIEAGWEAMDLAEAHWKSVLARRRDPR